MFFIGRGGATIREITKASRARVDVHRNYEADANSGQQQQPANVILPALSTNAANSEKVISIFGKEGESISTACKKILEVSPIGLRFAVERHKMRWQDQKKGNRCRRARPAVL